MDRIITAVITVLIVTTLFVNPVIADDDVDVDVEQETEQETEEESHTVVYEFENGLQITDISTEQGEYVVELYSERVITLEIIEAVEPPWITDSQTYTVRSGEYTTVKYEDSGNPMAVVSGNDFYELRGMNANFYDRSADPLMILVLNSAILIMTIIGVVKYRQYKDKNINKQVV